MRYTLLNDSAQTYKAIWDVLVEQQYIVDTPPEGLSPELLHTVLSSAIVQEKEDDTHNALALAMLTDVPELDYRYQIEISLDESKLFKLTTESGVVPFPYIRYVISSYIIKE